MHYFYAFAGYLKLWSIRSILFFMSVESKKYLGVMGGEGDRSRARTFAQWSGGFSFCRVGVRNACFGYRLNLDIHIRMSG